MDNKRRCKWCNLKNPIYVEYHDNEWGVPNFDNKYLYIGRENLVFSLVLIEVMQKC